MLRFYLIIHRFYTCVRWKTSFSDNEKIPRRIAPSDRIPFNDKRRRKEEKFFASCCAGMEEVAAEELKNPFIGANHIKPTVSGVTFRGGSMRTGYAACLWMRTANRILHLIAHGKLLTNQPASHTVKEFIEKLHCLDEFLLPNQSFTVRSSVWGSTTIKDNHTLNQYVQKALLSCMHKKGHYSVSLAGARAHVDVPFYITVYRNRIILYRDLTGPFLNSRGYRRVHHEAALSETQAAGLLYLAEWDKISQKEGAVYVDPMCGNGTLLCEAALMAKNYAPGLLRTSWPFTQWKDFNSKVWSQLVHQAEKAIVHQWKGHILGCDIHPIAVELAKESRSVISMEDNIALALGNCKDWKLKVAPSLVVVNPPWAIKKRREMPSLDLIPLLKQSWKELGQFLWESCQGSKVYFPCNHPFLYRQLSLHLTERSPLWIGGTQLGFYGIHLHNTGALNKHRHKRVRPTLFQLETRTKQDRELEIEHALSQLDYDPFENPLAVKLPNRCSTNKVEWELKYNWKLQKYQNVKQSVSKKV